MINNQKEEMGEVKAVEKIEIKEGEDTAILCHTNDDCFSIWFNLRFDQKKNVYLNISEKDTLGVLTNMMLHRDNKNKLKGYNTFKNYKYDGNIELHFSQ